MAVFTQEHQDAYHPMVCISEVITQSHTYLMTTDLEMFAIIFETAYLVRWILELQEHDYKIYCKERH